MKYAIIGNPNCGKTTIFNALTGLSQKVGNWSGVTVDKKIGFTYAQNQKIEITDLPGIYSLTASDQSSLDEQIATRYIIETKPDAVINVIDASNLERNLYLTMQLIEMNIPVILAVNMIDVAQKKGIIIHYNKLAQTLGCPVIPVIGRKKVGIDQLKNALVSPINPSTFNLKKHYDKATIALSAKIEHLCLPYPSLWLATRLIEDDYSLPLLLDEKTYQQLLSLKDQFITHKDAEIQLSTQRYQALEAVIQQSCDNQKVTRHKTTEIIDSICMHKYLGIPVFLFIMYLMFEFTITIGGALQPLFDNTSSLFFIDGITHLGVYLGLPLWLTAIIGQGIGLGLNTVLTFVPQIGCMFLFLSFLEDSGYMARAAYVMDRFMQAIGLPGKAFVPLIVGFGCNVPAIMAARTLETRRDRLMTIMMAPFMSCGARLAIFAVFASAFFPQSGALVVFGLYLIGILGAIITGYVIKFTILKGQSAPFVMELPVYHMPNFKTIVLHSWSRLKRFVFRAGKVIIPICVLVGTLNSIQVDGKVVAGGSQQSVLAQVGRSITPVLEPMGISKDNWQATVGLLTGTLAKEVVVGTLNTLYTQQEPETLQQVAKQPFDLWGGLKGAWDDTINGFTNMNITAFLNPFAAGEADTSMSKTAMGGMITSFGSLAAAFAYMLFVLLYIPCASTIGTMAREATRGWAAISVLWSTAIAYTSAIIVYQATLIISHPTQALSWIIGCVIFMGILVALMKHFAQRFRFELNLNNHCTKNCATAKGGCH
ncbi:Fe(2+) transporter permease subunit FeoB [Facilibium subflavum]|uniref:Fe(2+) transporter permease subunit FeoB n=1 Tax=Facilibium subflavum TaxID=2219058 RepID=UPI000E6573AE|nr:Fe(2+) transporter permease subunit FeoB [Facilibium subflavum]